MHAHNHITQAVAAMDSWFALIGAHPPGIAVGSIIGGLLAYQRTFTAELSNTALSASSTVNKWQLLVGNCKTVLPRHAYGDDITEKN